MGKWKLLSDNGTWVEGDMFDEDGFKIFIPDDPLLWGIVLDDNSIVQAANEGE